MKNKVLLTWNTTLADDTAISGFVIISQKKWKKYRKVLEVQEGGITMYVSTKDWIDYFNGKKLLEEITVNFLTDIEVSTITSKIGVSFGFTQFYDIFQIEDIW